MSLENLNEHSNNSDAFIAQAKLFDSKTVHIAPGQEHWSPAFIMHHVADGQLHFATRYFNALTIDNPPIIPFDEDIYPSLINYQERDWANSLEIIESLGELIKTVLTPITTQQWERTSLHAELGEVSISKLIARAGKHLAAHTEQLKEAM